MLTAGLRLFLGRTAGRSRRPKSSPRSSPLSESYPGGQPIPVASGDKLEFITPSFGPFRVELHMLDGAISIRVFDALPFPKLETHHAE